MHTVVFHLSLKPFDFRRQALILCLQERHFLGSRFDVFPAIEYSLLKLSDLYLVLLDFLDVLSLNQGLLTLNLFVLSLQFDDVQAEVVEFLLHFLAFLKLFAQLRNSLILLQRVRV